MIPVHLYFENLPSEETPPSTLDKKVRVVFREKYSCYDVLQECKNKDTEHSGVLGDNFFTIASGGKLSAPLYHKNGIPWHYHTDNDCLFSVEDWFIFLTGSFYSTLLLTDKRYKIFKKSHRLNFSDDGGEYKALAYARFCRKLEKDFHKSVFEITEEEIMSKYHVEIITEKSQ